MENIPLPVKLLMKTRVLGFVKEFLTRKRFKLSFCSFEQEAVFYHLQLHKTFMKFLSYHTAVLQTMIDLQKGQLLFSTETSNLDRFKFTVSAITFVKVTKGPSLYLGLPGFMLLL